MTDIQQRIAAVLRGHGVGDECLVDWTRPDRLAAALVTELGLREEEVVDFTGGAEIRYVTRTYPLTEGPLTTTDRHLIGTQQEMT